ncbi:hypothetical protein GQ600_17663 [Phytophthora cactorum]|nr:hypothetical protein GQ600_17663 [Phytophthora cactorum]
MTSSIVQCPTPSLQDAGSYVVSVSNNAQNFSPASQVARLTLHNEILLENASVMAGPATGGTSVDITGKFFVAPVIATEGIAPVPIRIALNGLTSPALYYAPPVADTISPVNVPVNTLVSLSLYGRYLISFGGICDFVRITMTSGFLEISVSLNGGRDFTQSRANLLVHEPIVIRGVDTPYVAQNVNSFITVRGNGFLNSSGSKCAFGESLTTASVITPEL